jgi:hypothetical protein
MHKLIIGFFMLISFVSVQAQVLNSGMTIKAKSFELGFAPSVMNDDFGLFIDGGYGLRPGMDLGVKLGFGYPETYFGADVEFMILRKSPFLSASAGFHIFGDPGLDATATFTIPLDPQIHLYTGLDMDLNFNDDKTRAPLWFFLGTEIAVKNNMTVLLEIEAGLNDPAYSIFSGGFSFYL